METIKEMLEGYNNIEAEIRDKKYAIINTKMLTKDASTSCYENVGNQKDFYVQSSLELHIANKDEKIRNLENEIIRLEAKRDMLDGYINTLKPVAKEIIELCYKAQWTEQKVADHLQMQLGGVQNNKKVSLDKMQKLYEKNRKEEV